jgi:hypothetical protein
MSDESLVVKPRDYSDIAKLQDPGVLEQFLDQPLTASLEAITGAFANGGKGLIVSAARIAQALVKGQMYDQIAEELRRLREAGKIPGNLGETKYGLYTWAELMAIIDNECPDPERLEALKAMFFAVNKVNISDGQRMAAYQLWLITKQLNSGELLLLKVVNEERTKPNPNFIDYFRWANHMAGASGNGVTGLVDLYEKRLTELCLLTARYGPDLSAITSDNARMSDLGIRVCENIKTYQNVMDEINRP